MPDTATTATSKADDVPAAVSFPNTEALPKQAREQRRFYLDARIDVSNGEPELYAIGEDNEDLSRETDWNENKKKNVFGNTVVANKRTGDSIDTDPFYAREGDAMSKLLNHFDLEALEGDKIKRDYYEAKIDNTGKPILAFKQVADITLQKVGGSSEDADNMPFNISLSGARIKCDFDLATETFTVKGANGATVKASVKRTAAAAKTEAKAS